MWRFRMPVGLLSDQEEFDSTWMDKEKFETARKGDCSLNFTRKNNKIREAALNYQVPFWVIAEALGMRDEAFSKKLRHELPEEEQAKILNIIQKIAAGELCID